jgi:hypothetical protein
MYNQHCKLNFSWIHILSDIKRTGLNYDCEKKTMYEGLSQKGCIMGVKLRLYDDEDEVNNVENPLDANIVKVEVEEVQDEIALKILRRSAAPDEDTSNVDLNFGNGSEGIVSQQLYLDENSIRDIVRKSTKGFFNEIGYMEKLLFISSDTRKIGLKISYINPSANPELSGQDCATQEIGFTLTSPYDYTGAIKLRAEYDDYLKLYYNEGDQKIQILNDLPRGVVHDTNSTHPIEYILKPFQGARIFIAELQTCGTGMLYMEFSLDS